MRKLSELKGFEWDDGNIGKNRGKHGVAPEECEQIFFNKPLLVGFDRKHSGKEKRYYALGGTFDKKLLFVVFTIRKEYIRIISARPMSKKERRIYEQKK
jgi:hypothetical protein